jgi:hypothetical protein
MNQKLVPDDFQVPELFENTRVRLRILTVNDVEKDYDDQKEFQKRSSFAYTVMSPDESECIGCVYIYPSPNSVYDSMVIMWVRQSEVKNGLDAHLSEIVKKWVREKWPFKNPGYPGRDIGWDEWNVFK